jgi:transaldolase
MQFFLDTANLDDIKKYASYGIVDGVTTNPSLVAKEKGVSFEKRIKDIAKIVNGPISAEVISTDTKGMVREGRKFAKWHKNITVKIPMTFEGLAAVRIFSKEKIKTNVTLIFSASQALLAAKAGATYMSPFIGRLDDISEDGMGLIKEIAEIYKQYNFKTRILVASVRHPRHVVEAAKLGADVCTIPPSIMDKLVKHPLTDSGLAKFLEDWKSVKK